MEARVDWMVRQEWVSPMMGEGIWRWHLAIPVGDEVMFSNGWAHTRLGVRWQVWRELRDYGVPLWRVLTRKPSGPATQEASNDDGSAS